MLTPRSARATEKPLLLSTEMQNEGQYITCYVMCDEMAGTLRSAELRPKLPVSSFPSKSINTYSVSSQTILQKKVVPHCISNTLVAM